MNWIYTIAIVIALVVVGFLLFIFMPKPTVFFDPYTNTTQLFAQHHDEILRETTDCLDPVIPIYGFQRDINSSEYPKIYELLRSMPYVRFAGIINIKPKFEQRREYGFADIANDTIRYFYTIKQSAIQKSGIWIDGSRKFFTDKEWICGDMSREHSLFNKDKLNHTTVLFIDIDRHPSIHNGCSPNNDIKKDEVLKMFEENAYIKGNTPELDGYESQDD